MVRAPEDFAAAAAHYVCVRITDMRDVDLRLLRFDFDLTLAIVLMHADGTIYHRYGTRPADDPLAWMSIASLVRLLDDTLADHRDYELAPTPPPAHEPLRPLDLPPLQQKLAAGQRIDCVHCHTVNDAEHRTAVARGTWQDDDKWVQPDPARIGLSLDPVDQALVRAVAADSAAARAGMLAGDRLRRLGAQASVRSVADVQWALHQAAPGDTGLAMEFDRGEEHRQAKLRLQAGWKRCTPADYAWRPYKWNLSPSPGFGGPALTAAERERLGIDTPFACRVQYLVDWGERAASGRAAAAAGIRKGDVVVAFAGNHDFRSVEHFQAWVRLQLQVGQEVELTLLRAGQRHTVRYALPE